jgi:hypothetical protein
MIVDNWIFTPLASDAPICKECNAASLRCAVHVERGYCEACERRHSSETRYASEGRADAGSMWSDLR